MTQPQHFFHIAHIRKTGETGTLRMEGYNAEALAHSRFKEMTLDASFIALRLIMAHNGNFTTLRAYNLVDVQSEKT